MTPTSLRSHVHRSRRALVIAAALAAMLGLASATAPTAFTPAAVASGVKPPAPGFTPNVRADAAEGSAFGQNEPQVAVDQTGVAQVTWQGSTNGYASASSRTTNGTTFTYEGGPDPNYTDLGDVAVTTTSWPNALVDTPAGAAGSNGIFWGNLGQTMCGGPINIRGATSIDQGTTWTAYDATCQPAQVDRDWVAAYTPPQFRGTAAATSHTWVYFEYHDFAVSDIWLARSSDGGQTWDPVQHSAIQPGGAAFASLCNTVPGGVAVDQGGAHPGRVYVVWETSDLASNGGNGCNYTQAQPFDHVFLSYSDDNGVTWTSTTVYNDPCAPNPPAPPTNPSLCQDGSEIFTPLAVDNAGNVYVAFVRRDISVPNPEYDIDLAWSTDGGNSFSGGTHTSPGPARKVNSDTGTHYFPWLAAGGNGGVDVVWYGTPYVEGVGELNKPAAAPGSAVWNVYMAESLNVPAGAPFVQVKVSTHPIYFGDICTTGIFCGVAPTTFNWGQDRILLDDFGVAVGPDGGARIAWTDAHDSWGGTCQPGGSDDSNVSCQQTHVYFACQSSGVGVNGDKIRGCALSTPPKS